MTTKFLTRQEAADYINSLGLPITFNTLQKFATVGGGPKYHRFGNRVVYDLRDIDAWIERRLSEDPKKLHAYA